MGNCVCAPNCVKNMSKRPSKALPIETSFTLPFPWPSWPPGEGFGSGIIDLGGGLRVAQISSLNKIWATHEGGPDNLGASFFGPSQMPPGFSMLGCYSQPNNMALHGWVLAAKDEAPALTEPVDYTLVWSSQSLKIKQDGVAYIWLPTPPDGYRALGHLVTNSPQKPPLDQIRCVRSDLTEPCETETWIWGSAAAGGFNIYSLRPTNRGTKATGVSVGTFVAQNTTSSSLVCLKNTNYCNFSAAMPNLPQIQAIFQAYSPWIYFHPNETYLPSSVTWFFTNGALLYTKGQESNPVAVEPTGSNLPQGGSNDGAYWLDLPVDQSAKERVKKGDLQDSQVYVHVKPMLGATFTDMAVWVFYPFNGPARAKIEFLSTVPLGRIGEHVGDWEHVTLRVSNFTGELWGVYFSEHSGGTWVKAPELEFKDGSNKPVTYASLNGHATYPKAGLVLQGNGKVGIRNDTAKSNIVMDAGERYSVVAAEYLGTAEPPWVNYFREWGPKISYKIEDEVKGVEKLLPGALKTAFEKLVQTLPNEVFGEQGPTGPKAKNNWFGDEV